MRDMDTKVDWMSEKSDEFAIRRIPLRRRKR